jgi:UPF0755 protein
LTGRSRKPVPKGRPLSCAAAPLLVLLGTAAFLAYWWAVNVAAPFKGWSSGTLLVSIPKGEGANRIYARLESAGLVRSEFAARVVHRIRFHGRPLRAGEYEFERAGTPADVLEKIVEGRAKQYPVRLREGLDRWQVVAEVDRALPWIDPDDLDEAIADPSPIRDLAPEARDLEGFLFPDTYEFTRGTTERDVVAALVRNFRTKLEAELRTVGGLPAGRSISEVVTLASIVEAETASGPERPRIAGVYANRLRIGMPMQCDPTTIYALKRSRRWNGDLTRSDLSFESPYNTYVSRGLPPGPIGNPGREAIAAALRPAPTKDLYFVSKNDGTHVFSESYEDHARAVQVWQRDYWRLRRAAERAGTAAPGAAEGPAGSAVAPPETVAPAASSGAGSP